MVYKWRNGELTDVSGASLEPWEILPGYTQLDFMPLGPGNASSYDTDSPRVAYIFEVVFDAADWLAGGTGLRWKREP